MCIELESVFDKISRYHIQIVLGEFNKNVGREDIFRSTVYTMKVMTMG